MSSKKSSVIKDIVLILVIAGLSIFPRLYKLEKLPPVVVDEPANLRDINIIFKNGFDPLGYHWDGSRTMLSHLPAVLLMKAFPAQDDLLSLRLTSVLISLCIIPVLYLLIAKKTDKKTAFFTTTLFMAGYFSMQFSRVGWNDVILVTLLNLLSILMIDLYDKSTLSRYVFLSGIVSGVSFYLYRSSAISITLSLIYIIFIEIKHRLKPTRFLFSILFFAGTFFLISAPWLIKIANNWDKYSLRSRVVSIYNVQLPYHGLNNFGDIIKYQIFTSTKSWLLFIPVKTGHHENPRYIPEGLPAINLGVAMLFWVGLILILKDKRTEYFAFILLIPLTIIAGQILTVDPPNGARAIIMLPSYYVISSYAISRIFKFFNKNLLMNFVFTLVLIKLALMDYLTYFNWMKWIKV